MTMMAVTMTMTPGALRQGTMTMTMAGTLLESRANPVEANLASPAAPPRTIIGTDTGSGCPPAAPAGPAAESLASLAEAREASLADLALASLASPEEEASLARDPRDGAAAAPPAGMVPSGIADGAERDGVDLLPGMEDGMMTGPVPLESPASRAEDPRAANREEDPAPESPASLVDLALLRPTGPARAMTTAMDGADLPPGMEDGTMMMMMTGPAPPESLASQAEAREASPADPALASLASLVDREPRPIGLARATMDTDGVDLQPGTADGTPTMMMMTMTTGRPLPAANRASPAEAREASPADQEAASQASLVTPPLLGA